VFGCPSQWLLPCAFEAKTAFGIRVNSRHGGNFGLAEHEQGRGVILLPSLPAERARVYPRRGDGEMFLPGRRKNFRPSAIGGNWVVYGTDFSKRIYGCAASERDGRPGRWGTLLRFRGRGTWQRGRGWGYFIVRKNERQGHLQEVLLAV